MTDEYISRKRTVELLKSQGSRDYRREKAHFKTRSSCYQVAYIRLASAFTQKKICGTPITTAMLAGCSRVCRFTQAARRNDGGRDGF